MRGHALRREYYYDLKSAVEFQVEGEWRNKAEKHMEEASRGKMNEDSFEKGICALSMQVHFLRQSDVIKLKGSHISMSFYIPLT